MIEFDEDSLSPCGPTGCLLAVVLIVLPWAMLAASLSLLGCFSWPR